LEPVSVLLTLTEIAIAIVGFAGIVTAIRPPEVPRLRIMTRWRLEVLVISGAGAVLFSVTPIPFLSKGFDTAVVWSWFGLACAVCLALLMLYTLARQRSLFGAAIPSDSIGADATLLGVSTASASCAIANTMGWGLQQEFAGYLLTISAWFFAALLVFLRSVLSSGAESD
jgi:hypothetical protein